MSNTFEPFTRERVWDFSGEPPAREMLPAGSEEILLSIDPYDERPIRIESPGDSEWSDLILHLSADEAAGLACELARFAAWVREDGI